LTVKKEGVDATQAFARGLEKATDPGGRTFHHFIEDAQTVYREASRRSEPTRKSVIPPGKGIDPQLKRTLREELPELPHEDPIAFRWDSLPEDVFFELDREDRVVRLNKEYRAAFNGGRRSGSNDAPVVKSMLYLLVNEIFQKERVRAVHNDNVALWNTVLVSAARCELAR
jgi:hypothetical protein